MKLLNFFGIIFLHIFLIFGVANPILAKEASHSDEQKSEEVMSTPPKEISKIQLPGLWIPTYNSRGKFRKMLLFTGSVTFVPKDFNFICVNTPKITDRFVVYINKNPIPKTEFTKEKMEELAQGFLKELHDKEGMKSIKKVILERGDIKQSDDNKLVSTACNTMRPSGIRK